MGAVFLLDRLAFMFVTVVNVDRATADRVSSKFFFEHLYNSPLHHTPRSSSIEVVKLFGLKIQYILFTNYLRCD